jgi:3-dehydroquinate dehydratase II
MQLAQKEATNMPGEGDLGAARAGSRGFVITVDRLAHPLNLPTANRKHTGEGAMRIMILNGPNLNMLGIREPHIYGSTTLDAIKAACEEFASFAGAQLSFHQSNHEGVMVDLIQSARTEADSIIINPAGYSFTSVAIFDALKIFEGPIFEVHISNIHARDELHRHSKLSAAVKGVIAGLGPYGYIVAMQAALQGAGKLPAAWPAALRVGPK